MNLRDQGFLVFGAPFKALAQIIQNCLCVAADGFALAEGVHGDLVDRCPQRVVVRMADADRAASFVLGKHQNLVRLAVGDQKWCVGGDQHFLREFTLARQALAQAADEVCTPVGIEVRFVLTPVEN